jgi:DNA-binding MarR family transcriptional regulator
MEEVLAYCPYRKSRLGSLVCSVAIVDGSRGKTDNVSTHQCAKCVVPKILEYSQCANLSVGKFIQLSYGQDYGTGTEINCEPIGFDNANDYAKKCSPSCPKLTPIHQPLEQLLPFEMTELQKNSTDKQLRQAVLEALYKYHAQHPERYGRFDVTPEFLAKTLKLEVKDIVRVVAPMEERGEVKTAQAAGDKHLQYLYITAKGIESIDTEPLFHNTAALRELSVTITDSPGSALTIGNNSSASVTWSPELTAQVKNYLAELKKVLDIPQVENEIKDTLRQNIDVVEQQLEAPTVNIPLTTRAYVQIETALKKIDPIYLAAGTNDILQFAKTLADKIGVSLPF